MEKRVVIFLILSLTILVGYEYVLRQMGLTPPPSQQTDQQAPASTVPQTSEAAATPEKNPAAAPISRPDERAASVPAGVQTIEVVTDLYRAAISNRGGVITSWELTRYRLTPESASPPVQLVHKEGKFAGPLSLHTTDEALTQRVNEALYEVERDFSRLDAAHPTGHLTLTYRAPGQAPGSPVHVEKQLTFHHDSYVVDVAVVTEGISGTLATGLGTNFGIVEWSEGLIGLIGPASRIEDKIEKDLPDTEQELKGNVKWVALQDKYFMSVAMPTGATAVWIKKEGERLASAQVRFPAPSVSAPLTFRLYAGPKEFEILKTLDAGLEDTIDFGWFIFGSWDMVKAVAKPLFSVLRFLHDYTQNYGIAIVLLTVGIKLLFAPLQYKSYKSMKEMQLLQPKVLALQTKYKDDRDRLNKELIKLYRDHKVNPVGGCLPMLLQMPVFVALFNVLYMTIELRQAPFLLWVTDLSIPDPYYVLPILMGVTMMIQQKITPTTMDPVQAKIMLLLPAFMTLLFLNFASGLVLYWFTNNLLTIGQQFVTDRYIYRQPTFSASSDQPTT
ncbi:MAG: membrane protein insertase YidC [Nitrospiraceae bacterium]|nr:membrane protein insertase YidC [Nitrospiraceae bacterium]MSR24873.1 membrane protein insertase YidC [Nitrospiraceae bacterium]